MGSWGQMMVKKKMMVTPFLPQWVGKKNWSFYSIIVIRLLVINFRESFSCYFIFKASLWMVREYGAYVKWLSTQNFLSGKTNNFTNYALEYVSFTLISALLRNFKINKNVFISGINQFFAIFAYSFLILTLQPL